jgi:uncharacterized membrane protein YphA (DoxX/SURF4 family)
LTAFYRLDQQRPHKAGGSLVPTRLLFRAGWAYLTGVGQIACGAGILLPLYPRVAATVEAGMLTLFTLFVWAPAIAAAATKRLPWTAFFISWAIAAARVTAANMPVRSLS